MFITVDKGDKEQVFFSNSLYDNFLSFMMPFPLSIVLTFIMPQLVILLDAECGLFNWSVELSAGNPPKLISWRGHAFRVSFFFSPMNWQFWNSAVYFIKLWM